MARKAKTEEQVADFRGRILDAALGLIEADGLKGLTMRRLAARLDVTATTIYNYFRNRDELYYAVRASGFERLHERLNTAIARKKSPADRLKALITAYVQFGLENAEYFDLMFVNRSVPKYRDMVGTEFESVALVDLESGLRVFGLVASVIGEYRALPTPRIRYLTERFWCETTGLVALINSQLLHEVEANVHKFCAQMIDDMHSGMLHSLDRYPTGKK